MIDNNIKKLYYSILSKKRRTAIRKEMQNVFEVSKTTISNWVNGRINPPEIYHEKIAEIFGVSVEELFNSK